MVMSAWIGSDCAEGRPDGERDGHAEQQADGDADAGDQHDLREVQWKIVRDVAPTAFSVAITGRRRSM